MPKTPQITHRAAALLLIPLLMAPFGAQAATTIYGGGAAQENCFKAARDGRSDDAALSACKAALESRTELDVNNRNTTLVNLGIIQLRRRDGAAALEAFDAALALSPNNAEAHLNRGAALVMINQPGPAVAAITTALSLGVSAPHKAYFNRAAAREAMGDVRGAYEDYNTALTIKPDWGDAEAELARFARGRRERLAAQLDPDAGAH
jgi:tetratricopeptide (TPR) repeat protein